MNVFVQLPFAWLGLPTFTGPLALLDVALVIVTIFWILTLKREPMSAIAWCLIVIFVPIMGVALFILFGYQSIHRPLERKKRQAVNFRAKQISAGPSDDDGYEGLAKLACQIGADPLTHGNTVQLYHDGITAYNAMLEAIHSAQHHIHIEFFIVRGDESGRKFMEALAERAKAGVQVRFLYDAVGSWRFTSRVLHILTRAGGRAEPFLTLLNPLRRRMQINLRNHRKILVVDGCRAFTGGLNLGDEYLGLAKFFGYWRDMFMQVQGRAVRDLQRVFAEDWEFATGEQLPLAKYVRRCSTNGPDDVQVLWSGPDQEVKIIREVYFAALMRAKQRIWLATPYFVPDAALLDALCLAARSGRDVRVLCPLRPDKWIPHLAGRYYWPVLLRTGVKVYQYTNGFMHTKLLMIDDEWCSIGTANFDNRSLLLNFEVTCIVESAQVAKEMEAAFLRDCEVSIRLDAESFARRPYVTRMAENASRLLSPIL